MADPEDDNLAEIQATHDDEWIKVLGKKYDPIASAKRGGLSANEVHHIVKGLVAMPPNFLEADRKEINDLEKKWAKEEKAKAKEEKANTQSCLVVIGFFLLILVVIVFGTILVLK
jgi:hypothetical protein